MALEVVAVTGASGWVGSAVARSLERRGCRVVQLSRNPAATGARRFDLEDPGGLVNALQGCDRVVHCAAHVHHPIESVFEQERFATVNVEGTRGLLAASEQAGVRRFVFVSTIAVYDWAGKPGPRSERSILAPATAYAQSKATAEELVRGFRHEWCVARLATVYGTGDRANFARLASALRRGRFLMPGTGHAEKSLLSIDMAGETLAELAMAAIPVAGVYNIASPEVVSLQRVCDTMSTLLCVPKARRMPLPLARKLAVAGDVLLRLGIQTGYDSRVLEKLTTSTTVDVCRFLEFFPGQQWEPFERKMTQMKEHYASC